MVAKSTGTEIQIDDYQRQQEHPAIKWTIFFLVYNIELCSCAEYASNDDQSGFLTTFQSYRHILNIQLRRDLTEQSIQLHYR